MPKIIQIDRLTYKDNINWSKWDELVKQTKEEIEALLDNYKAPSGNNKLCYTYNFSGELCESFNSIKELAVKLDSNADIMSRYVANGDIFNGLLVSDELMTKDVAFATYRNRLTSGRCHFPKSNQTRKSIIVYVYGEDGQLVGVYESIAKFKAHGGLWFDDDRIIGNNLVSRYFYDEKTAKEVFKTLNVNKR